MVTITNIEDYREANRKELANIIFDTIEAAQERYDEIIIRLEERTENTKADVDFIFGSEYLEEEQNLWTATFLIVSGMFERYKKKFSKDAEFIKLQSSYEALEIDYKELFDEYLS